MKIFIGRTFMGFAVATLVLAAATPSDARNYKASQPRDYKYCLYRDMMDGGDCMYATYEQCQASASGRIGDCRINPRWAFARQLQR